MFSRLGPGFAALAAAILVASVFAPATYDDAYITYRYADNLARGHGFVFNPGEAVLGTSAPGYAALLAALATIGRPFGLTVAVAASAVSLAALVALAIAFVRFRTPVDEPPRPPGVADYAFVLLLLGSRWIIEMLGSETVPATALLAWAFLLVRDARHPVLAGLLTGLAVTFRADTAFAALALTLALWWIRRRFPARFVAAGLLAPLTCAVWLVRLFGSPLPSTLAGKRSEIALAHGGYLAAEWDWLVRSFSGAGAVLLLLSALAALLLRGEGDRRNRSERILFLAAAAWIGAHELFYRLVGVPFSPWYQVAPLVALLALAAAGLERLATGLPRPSRGSRVPGWRRAAGLCAALAVVLPAAIATGRFWREHWSRPPDPRLRVYRDVADELVRRSPANGSVAAVEIGALAYFSDHRVVDLVGIVDPAILEDRLAGRLADRLRAAPPDYVLDNPNFHDSFLAFFVRDEALRADYREIATFRRPEYPFELRLLARRTDLTHALTE
ncbi:MAG: hypothetical protein AB7G12_10005 [Thermoanaerobaculia bacterium]